MTEDEIKAMAAKYRANPESLWDGKFIMDLLVALWREKEKVKKLEQELKEATSGPEKKEEGPEAVQGDADRQVT